MSPGTVRKPRAAEGAIAREVPTTAYPALMKAAAMPAPMPCEAPVTIATFMRPGTSRRNAARRAAGHADEDTLVQPVELARRGLDLGRGAKDVRARVDVLAAS